MQDSWELVQEELKKMQDEAAGAPDAAQLVDAISVADFWKRRYDDEKVTWERRLEAREGEKRELRLRAEDHASSLKQLEWKLKDLERRWEQEKLLLEDRVRAKEIESRLEQTKFQWEKRIEALEEENRYLKTELGLADGAVIPGSGTLPSPLLERSWRARQDQALRTEQDARRRLDELEAEKAAAAQALAAKEKEFIAERQSWQKLEKETALLSTQMGAELASLKAREEEHFVILEDLARGLAHRARNYLGIISGTIQLSVAQYAMEPELAEQLAVVDRNVQDMLVSIEDFLKLARIPEMSIQPRDINQLAGAALDGCAAAVAAKKITVKKTLGAGIPPYPCDQKLFAEALRHLLDNAVDALQPGGVLTVGTAWDPAARAITVTIGDNGSGISETQIKKIFQPYFTSKKDHKGLGLTIVKRVVDLHHGTVQITSAPRRGTTAVMTLFAAG